MNWLDMMDPQKRRAMELMQQQQMQAMQQYGIPQMLQAQQMPQGMGALQNMPMQMQQGQAGYGVLAPEANTAMNQAAAEGNTGANVAGLLAMASNIYGQNSGTASSAPPAPTPPPPTPVGTSKEGLAKPERSVGNVQRKRKYQRSAR